VDYHWVTMDELAAYPFPKANLKFIPKLIAHSSWLMAKSKGQ
jgi:hypothetical protein